MKKLFRRPMVLSIDTHGRCNLTCPSCPRGRDPKALVHKFIAPESLANMLAILDRQIRIQKVLLQSWTEPTMHPKLPELIETAKEFTGQVCISSNLNYQADFEAIMEARPSEVTASCSGWTHDTYDVTHRRGDVDKFKANLAEIVKWRRGDTRIVLSYHCYSHNRHDRDAAMLWCHDHGVYFAPAKAKLLPLESVMDVFEYGDRATLTDDERMTVNLLEEPIPVNAEACRKHHALPCRAQDHELVLNCNGEVTLCCNLWDPLASRVGNVFLDSVAEMQRLKKVHSICARCASLGGHVYMVGGNTRRGRFYVRAADLWARTFGRLGLRPDSVHRFVMKGN